jgi:hypothetical protein
MTLAGGANRVLGPHDRRGWRAHPADGRKPGEPGALLGQVPVQSSALGDSSVGQVKGRRRHHNRRVAAAATISARPECTRLSVS